MRADGDDAAMTLWKRILVHWKALAGVAVAYALLRAAPDWISTGLAILILSTVIAVPVINGFAERRLRSHVTRHIEAMGCSVVQIRKWREHFGVTFIAGGKRHYVRFEQGGWGAVVDWVDGPPEEHVA